VTWTALGQWIEVFATKHEEALGLFGLAMAVTMRPKLPWPFNRVEILEWLYEWVRDGLMTFISMRGPAHSEASVEKTTKTAIDTQGKTIEVTSSVKAEEGTHEGSAK
jgi:hypothetical protein